MQFTDCLSGRRSVRRFEPTKISHSDFEQIVQLATYAPSWKNGQIARYTLVQDDAVIQHIATDCVLGSEFNTKILTHVPSLVVVSYVEKRSGYDRDGSFTTSKGDGWSMFDAGIASQTFCLAAYEQGFGTVIMGVFDDEKLAQAVALPDGQRVAAIIPIGIAGETPPMPKRKPAEDLVRYL